MTMIIRFVSVSKVGNEVNVKICEHFLGFVPIEKATGLQLSEILINQLSEMQIPIEHMRGQGYDNGSNMRGLRAGVQSRIRNINPRAFFVPCSSHSLNLVVNDMASTSLEATIFFGIIQKTYVFFAASAQRWDTLKRHISSLTLKPLSTTRKQSRCS